MKINNQINRRNNRKLRAGVIYKFIVWKFMCFSFLNIEVVFCIVPI